jgi:hypothetical protein
LKRKKDYKEFLSIDIMHFEVEKKFPATKIVLASLMSVAWQI